MGAKQFKRIDKILMECLGIVVWCGSDSRLVLLFRYGRFLLLYLFDRPGSDSNWIDSIVIYLYHVFFVRYHGRICGKFTRNGVFDFAYARIYDGVCVFRIFWIFTIFQAHRELSTLYISYPISWILTIAVDIVCYIYIRKND